MVFLASIFGSILLSFTSFSSLSISFTNSRYLTNKLEMDTCKSDRACATARDLFRIRVKIEIPSAIIEIMIIRTFLVVYQGNIAHFRSEINIREIFRPLVYLRGRCFSTTRSATSPALPESPSSFKTSIIGMI